MVNSNVNLREIFNKNQQIHSIRADPVIFEKNFNQRYFKFQHDLGLNPIFDTPCVSELARRMMEHNDPHKFSALGFSDADLGSRFSDLARMNRVDDLFGEIQNGKYWVKLSRCQDFDPDYAELFEKTTNEIDEYSGGEFATSITWSTITLFISLPNIVTPFHIDHETNFLFQIRGSKDVCLFPSDDRELLPEREIERFYNGNSEAARYRPDLQPRGTVYRLNEGDAVHHPPLAPHWVRNCDALSISASLAYCCRPLEDRARVYQANFIMRTLALTPTPPGRSGLIDRIKIFAVNLFAMRAPRTYHEVVFGPLVRMKLPFTYLRRLLRRK